MIRGKGRGSNMCMAVQDCGSLIPVLIALVQTPTSGIFTLHWCDVSTVSTLLSSCAGSLSTSGSTTSWWTVVCMLNYFCWKLTREVQQQSSLVQVLLVFRVTVPQWNRQTVWEICTGGGESSALRFFTFPTPCLTCQVYSFYGDNMQGFNDITVKANVPGMDRLLSQW